MSKASYSILKVPVSQQRAVFYYYRQYNGDLEADPESLGGVDPPPSDRTLYVVHFEQPIEESFLLRTFAHGGPIKQIHLGKFRPKASNKKNKRTVHFGLVVLKHAESV